VAVKGAVLIWKLAQMNFLTIRGEFARSVRRRGELVLAFQYVNTEPAMVIWSGTRQAGSLSQLAIGSVAELLAQAPVFA
jgi:hypothetical protein